MQKRHDFFEKNGLYQSEFEHDNCGFGLMVNRLGRASHNLLLTSINALSRMSHRGAVSADGKSGDGCGILMKMPIEFIKSEAKKIGFDLADVFSTGLIFLSQDPAKEKIALKILTNCLLKQGLNNSKYREVPVNTDVLGESAKQSCPSIKQLFINKPKELQDSEFNYKLFLARRDAEKSLVDDPCFYVVSLHSKTMGYKGLVTPENLPSFYLDLQNENMKTDLCVFHQRFSTNTLPQWRLSQPFRYVAHNGEINTINSNRVWINAKNELIYKSNADAKIIMPIVSSKDSDSCSLDNVAELIHLNGMSLLQTLRIMVPAAWQNQIHMDPDLRAFYEYYAMHMGSWDGPAGIVTSDGRYAICALDRNGLRPARWVRTSDENIMLASEIGVYDYPPESVVSKGRLAPGEMFSIDTYTGEILNSIDIDNLMKKQKPYKEWLDKHLYYVSKRLTSDNIDLGVYPKDKLHSYKKMFNFTYEEQEQVLKPLSLEAREGIGSMGDDTPLAVLSTKIRPLYDYFRQQFAQVTNPPIDPLRENIVMSLKTFIGRIGNVGAGGEDLAERMVIEAPIVSSAKFDEILNYHPENYPSVEIDLNYPITTTLKDAVLDLCQKAIKNVKAGKVLLILSDENIDKNKYPVHALLATGAIHHSLCDVNLRCNANLVVKTATVRDSHQLATLIGYGATAVYPYFAYQCIYEMHKRQVFGDASYVHAAQNFRKGLKAGLKKIISKMGIATITSYRGSQLFEIIGLDSEVTNICFKGTASRVEGASFDDLQHEQMVLTDKAFNVKQDITHGGKYKYVYGEEYHAFNPDVIRSIQKAVQTGQYKDYLVFANFVNKRQIATLRDMFGLVKSESNHIHIDSVEKESEILKRFDSAGMSLGALSPEAHEAIAVAMNNLGGRSNSGEGGEAKERYNTSKVSKIKQVASGRFGVTPEYLINAEVIQIKVAQGAKPGEGGQLPGGKVNKLIAKLRFASVGVALISPPPHHDIYSIEDLAQLIFDLKQVNPSALISVKLVAEAGIGTIAAGVTKANADLITVSGADGGTGASPLTSIVYAGGPWELGLTEIHQTLVANDLRSRIRLQVDGGLKTGLDVVKAAILGAESFGFGTVPMVALGCKYLRICHLNNCATGVATQNKILRTKHFHGTVEKLMNYFKFVAQDTRLIMAQLGVSKLTDLIGRTDLLEKLDGDTIKQKKLDMSRIVLHDDKLKQCCTVDRNKPLDAALLAKQIDKDTHEAIQNKLGGVFSYTIKNIDRSIGAMLSGKVAKLHGDLGMSESPINIHFKGCAGQSFGVFNAGGIHLHLEGDANDYVGKGMAGGKIFIMPPKKSSFSSSNTPIIGNTCLYGATGGLLYASGTAGERFAIRNSGALAVVEGAGNHCCEYMTGGVVVVLGAVGLNFGAGMTGGMAYVLDVENTFADHYNNELVNIHRVQAESMVEYRGRLYELLEDFAKVTGSKTAQNILHNFSDMIKDFWLVMPINANVNDAVDKVSMIS